MSSGASKQGTSRAIDRIGETEMDDRRDTSMRDSIKGARVPLTLLAVHKTRVKSSRVDLHDGFLLPPAVVVSCGHESSLIERLK